MITKKEERRDKSNKEKITEKIHERDDRSNTEQKERQQTQTSQ